MIAVHQSSFHRVRQELAGKMLDAPSVHTERWQGVDISKDPAACSYELLNVAVSVPLLGIERLDHWREDIEPNLPWADDHFEERVGGEPLNPGVEWANWPWGKSADRFRDGDGIFNHTYMERLWPKYARRQRGDDPHSGIGWRYGDLDDLVDLLVVEPLTRQAYIPLFFPEDTGIGDGGRKPCTLGYHIIVRKNRAHIYYPIRACDLVRHFQDDCYMAVRLLLWIIDQCRDKDVTGIWNEIGPGSYTMHCTSLHVFENDMIQMRRDS